MMDQLDFSVPVLPYRGTSGHSGSETSRSRAIKADREGVTAKRQKRVLEILEESGAYGSTWKEIADEVNLHHGSASGALSVLHKTGRICRLKQIRNDCKIYVLPKYVNGREIEKHGGRIVGSHVCAGVKDNAGIVAVCSCVSLDMYQQIADHVRNEVISEIGAFANDYHHHIDGRDVVIVDQLITFLKKAE